MRVFHTGKSAMVPPNCLIPSPAKLNGVDCTTPEEEDEFDELDELREDTASEDEDELSEDMRESF
jgi:hypothetical protein